MSPEAQVAALFTGTLVLVAVLCGVVCFGWGLSLNQGPPFNSERLWARRKLVAFIGSIGVICLILVLGLLITVKGFWV